MRPLKETLQPYLEEALEKKRPAPTLALVALVLFVAVLGAAYGGYFTSQWAPATLVLAALALIASLSPRSCYPGPTTSGSSSASRCGERSCVTCPGARPSLP